MSEDDWRTIHVTIYLPFTLAFQKHGSPRGTGLTPKSARPLVKVVRRFLRSIYGVHRQYPTLKGDLKTWAARRRTWTKLYNLLQSREEEEEDLAKFNSYSKIPTSPVFERKVSILLTMFYFVIFMF